MGLIGDIFTGLGSRNAAKSAATDQANAESSASTLLGQTGAQGVNVLQNAANQNAQNFSPYTGTGVNALGQMSEAALSGGWASQGYNAALPTQQTVNATPFTYNANSLTNDPSYQFSLNQGLSTLGQTLNAQGVTGGPAAEALTRYATDYAGTQYAADYARQQQTAQQNFQNSLSAAQQNYGQAANNYQLGENTFNTNNTNLWNRLNSLASMGYGATNSLGSLTNANAANLANTITGSGARQANAIEGIGNALAGGSIGAANAMSGANANVSKDLQSLASLFGG